MREPTHVCVGAFARRGGLQGASHATPDMEISPRWRLACLAVCVFPLGVVGTAKPPRAFGVTANQVLEWNQIFIDTLIATNTANSSSQRLGAIVHTAIFDAYNGIERRYAPIFVPRRAPRARRAGPPSIAAAYTALVGLFPSRQAALDASYAGVARHAAANIASTAIG